VQALPQCEYHNHNDGQDQGEATDPGGDPIVPLLKGEALVELADPVGLALAVGVDDALELGPTPRRLVLEPGLEV
jgi:hypothetical protein